MESEKALVPFNNCDFKFTNHKFLDLNAIIPEHEKGEFSVVSKHHNETQIMKDVYLNFIENMLHEDIIDFTARKRRQFIVNSVWRTYQFGAYYYLSCLTFKYLQYLTRIGLGSLIT